MESARHSLITVTAVRTPGILTAVPWYRHRLRPTLSLSRIRTPLLSILKKLLSLRFRVVTCCGFFPSLRNADFRSKATLIALPA